MKQKTDKFDLGYDDEIEEDGFIDAPIGTPVASFDFMDEAVKPPLIDNRRL